MGLLLVGAVSGQLDEQIVDQLETVFNQLHKGHVLQLNRRAGEHRDEALEDAVLGRRDEIAHVHDAVVPFGKSDAEKYECHVQADKSGKFSGKRDWIHTHGRYTNVDWL